MASIFICYRVDDAGNIAGRIADALKLEFGRGEVYFAEDRPAGSDYQRDYLSHVRDAKVVLVLIGPQWLRESPATGRPRLLDEGDHVRNEIQTALELEKTIVPVLVHNTPMPAADQLPDSLRQLHYRNACQIGDGSAFKPTLRGLSDLLKSLTGVREQTGPRAGDIAMLVLGIVLTVVGFWLEVAVVAFDTTVRFDFNGVSVTAVVVVGLLSRLFLGVGPPLIAFSRWRCCYRAAQMRAGAFLHGTDYPRAAKSRMAMVALLLALASFGLSVLTAIPAIVLAIMAIRNIKKHPHVLEGLGPARCAIVVAILASVTSVWVTSVSIRSISMTQAIDRGQRAMVSGHFQQAIDAYTGAMLYGDSAIAHYGRANAFLRQGGPWQNVIDDASAVIEGVRETSFNRLHLSDAYAWRAFAHFKLGNETAARSDLASARRLNPSVEIPPGMQDLIQ